MKFLNIQFGECLPSNIDNLDQHIDTCSLPKEFFFLPVDCISSLATVLNLYYFLLVLTLFAINGILYHKCLTSFF